MTVLRDVRQMVQVVVIVAGLTTTTTATTTTTTVREPRTMWMEDPGEVVAEADGIRIKEELAIMMMMTPPPPL